MANNTTKLDKNPPLSAKPRMRPQKKRRWILWLSLILWVIGPGMVSAWYWFTQAPERFVTEAGFTVRAVDEGFSTDMLSSLTGMSGAGPTSSDTAVVLSFLHSRDIIEKINTNHNLENIFQKVEDPLYTYKGETIEDLVEYWENRLLLTHDTTTGLVTFEFEAFTREDSYQIAQDILTQVESLINDISQKARSDVLKASQDELTRAQERLKIATENMRQFRGSAESLNPFGSGEALVELIAGVEAQISEVDKQLTILKDSNVRENSPNIVNLEREKRALMAQLDTLRASSAQDANLMANFEQLELEKQFAQQSYASSLAALEQARVRADSAQRYLAVFRQPQQAQSAIRPSRGLNTFLTLVALFATWSITTLLTYHVRDKMA